MMLDVHRHLYEHSGWTLIPEAFPPTEALVIERRALEAIVDFGIFKEGTASGGGHSKYWVLDGMNCLAEFPRLFDWYEAQHVLVEEIVGRKIVLSPWLRSAINIKVYKGNRNGQGWHYDTNPVSAVLNLSDSGAPIILRDIQSAVLDVQPQAGQLLLMQGREVFHSVEESDETRVTAVFNYYHPDDCERPDWIDRAIYENQEPPRIT